MKNYQDIERLLLSPEALDIDRIDNIEIPNELGDKEITYIKKVDLQEYAQSYPDAYKNMLILQKQWANNNPIQGDDFSIFLTSNDSIKFSKLCIQGYLSNEYSFESCISFILLFLAVKQFKIDESFKMKPLNFNEVKSLLNQNDAFLASDDEINSNHPNYYQLSFNNFSSNDFVTFFTDLIDHSFVPEVFSGRQLKVDSYEIIIPSYAAMQAYLNKMNPERPLRFAPRLGETSAAEIIAMTDYNLRTLGIDEDGKQRPDGLNHGTYGFSLHDFYHSHKASKLSNNQNKLFIDFGKNILNNLLEINGPIRPYLSELAFSQFDLDKDLMWGAIYLLDREIMDVDSSKKIPNELKQRIKETLLLSMKEPLAYYVKNNTIEDGEYEIYKKLISMITLLESAHQQPSTSTSQLLLNSAPQAQGKKPTVNLYAHVPDYKIASLVYSDYDNIDIIVEEAITRALSDPEKNEWIIRNVIGAVAGEKKGEIENLYDRRLNDQRTNSNKQKF